MYVLSKIIKNIKIFLVKFSIFTAEKNLCILHWHVFLMRKIGENQIEAVLNKSNHRPLEIGKMLFGQLGFTSASQAPMQSWSTRTKHCYPLLIYREDSDYFAIYSFEGSRLCLVWVRAPLWPHVRQAKFCLRVCQVVFLGVLPFSPHLLIGPSHMS